MASSSATLASSAASDLLRSSTGGFTGVPLRTLGRTGLVLKRRDLTVSVTAKLRKVKKKEYPWSGNLDPNVKGGVLTHLSPFKPLKEKPKPVILDFEKPLLDLEKKISDVRKMADETGLDFSDQISSLENKYQKALKNLYTHLTPIQRVNIARHPHRPTCLDHIFNITDKFMELHGDRNGYDDPAIVTGLGSIDGRTYMFIGHQKGRNTKESINRNFGMPTPHGYRKALRMMEYADHHGFPVVTFIDTPGAYADLKSEELNQGEAIAHNLRSMFGLKVPVISIVIGEGGSGGALAIGCANKLLMLENGVFYVASPEACAAILWKSSKAAPKAAKKLKITATELCKLKVADGVIPEPLGGAHVDPSWTSQQIKIAINKAMDELTKMNTEDLLKHRMLKFRKLGGFKEGIPVDPKKKRNMKKSDIPPAKISVSEVEVQIEKLKQQILKSSSQPPKLNLDKTIKKLEEKLEKEVDQELSEAAKALGLTQSLSKLRDEFSKASSDDQPLDPLLKGKIEKLQADFNRRLSAAPNANKLKKKHGMLKELTKVKLLLSDRNKDIPPAKISDSKVEVQIEKLKQQILKSSSQPPKLDLDETLKKLEEKLEKEVDQELSEAAKALGLTESLSKLRDELPKASSDDQPLDPLLKGKIEKLQADFNRRLSAAPNANKLKKKHDELTKVKLLLSDRNKEVASSKINKEAATLTQELKKKFDDVMNNPRIKENYEALQSEIQRASSASDLDDELKKKIIEFNNEVDLQVANAVKSVGLDVQFVKPGQDGNKFLVREIEELNKDVKKEIDVLANSSTDIKRMIEQLKVEVAKAGGTPNSESKNRIVALTQKIKRSLAEAVGSSSLKERYENLMSGTSGDGSLKVGNGLTDDELREKVGANCSFS
ncbi:acetyl-coenzyme A carboxylase carboxyl transferase subunit alpha, chloroplastic isoform X1 [Medicago truncatula]|uniref:acetyl-coenzyme A carboxylase carboxyl transferase subunit alpha, chloroplastic isoform X1 n=1 Tax=Medicago truncatula TaxID=3880 RepID=UPI0019676411|nr:acetyl-coenzyme A carboxylase carboxyl transferase subunit alpha, chloroplastic isoform X1 [Medicago truncatula]XP_039684097.1 acetyl-coenzyme A carboxylase carboxyl transferase subunit alpha, chloroplastic isoform X1 [Medicago truncatula]